MDKIKGNKTVIALLVLCVLALVFTGVYFGLRAQPAAGEKTLQIQVVADGADKSFEIQTEAEFLLQALEEAGLIEGEDSQFGFFVTTVDGRRADTDKQEWWSLTRDGEFLTTGVSETPVADGDHFEITLTVGY